MTALGVVQDGDRLLRRIARRFDLPAETEDARRVITELHSATERISQAHTFGKGMGVAAPQIGIDRAAALVRPPGADDAIILLNPTIVETSTEVDEQYEGCLSFFDIRCLVPRPLVIHVEHTELTGEKKVTVFDRGVARLVAHEVDHLYGILCRDHLADGAHPSPSNSTKAPARPGTTATIHRNLRGHHDGPLPIITGSIIRLSVDRLPGDRHPKPVWMWCWATELTNHQLNRLRQAYIRRFDLEHTFRFLKQTLGWTRPQIRIPDQADHWTWLIITCHTQLRLARPLAEDLRRPWEKPVRRPRPAHPARVRRGFRHLRSKITQPASAPKPTHPGPAHPAPQHPSRPTLRRRQTPHRRHQQPPTNRLKIKLRPASPLMLGHAMILM